jgi:hypothetical protein
MSPYWQVKKTQAQQQYSKTRSTCTLGSADKPSVIYQIVWPTYFLPPPLLLLHLDYFLRFLFMLYGAIREHAPHSLHLWHIPFTDGLIEWYSMLKHVHHIRHLRHIPIADRLVERCSRIEYIAHASHIWRVPSTDPKWDRLIERFSTEEHILHGGDAANIPGTDIVIELPLLIKQPVHVGNVGHVPFADASVLFSAAAGSEHQNLTAILMSPSHLDSLFSRYGRNILPMKAAVKHIREFLLCNSYKHSMKARYVTFKGFTDSLPSAPSPPPGQNRHLQPSLPPHDSSASYFSV